MVLHGRGFLHCQRMAGGKIPQHLHESRIVNSDPEIIQQAGEWAKRKGS